MRIKVNFRKKALELYRQGKNMEEIQKVVGIPVEVETMEKWDEEDKKYNSIKKFVKECVKLRQKLRNRDKLTDSQRILYNEQLKDAANSILEIDSENIIAKKDLFNALYNLKEWEQASDVGKQILESEEKNIVVLNKLANISFRKKDYDSAIEYLEEITVINSDNQNFKQKLEEIKQIAQKLNNEQQKTKTQTDIPNEVKENNMNQNEFLKSLQVTQNENADTIYNMENYNESIEEKQERFAREKMANENKYTLEEQEEYIKRKKTEFINGDIRKQNLEEIWEELKKYPDKTKGLIFILDLYSKITEQYTKPVEILEKYAEEVYTLTPKEYNDILNEMSKYRELYKSKEEEKEK